MLAVFNFLYTLIMDFLASDGKILMPYFPFLDLGLGIV